ncbi:MAG TPA: hypothetical protein VMR23_17130 [Candidatus Limnocylindria bacterium]|nr:hypothetical protein [Candidatus Limnocylindria bacterium]
MSPEDERARLRDLSARIVRLHTTLLERERGLHEERAGPIAPAELFRLVLHDEHFAWLRALSALIARIDALVDAPEPVSTAGAQGLFGEAYRLLKSGSRGAFGDRYREALQASPDVVIAHADVSRVLRPPPG